MSMDDSKRQLIKLGAAVAAGAVLTARAASAQSATISNPLPGKLPPIAGLRLVSYAPNGKDASRIGVVQPNGRIVDVETEAARQKVSLSFDPTQMISLIAAGNAGLAEVHKLVSKADKNGPLAKDVRLLAPIPNPQRNVYAVGWNYVEHFEESKGLRTDPNQKLPEHPVFFTKGTHTVNGPFDPIPFDPAVSVNIDWEGELAVIIGKRGRNITEAQAMDYVFGFSVINDTTARDVQQKKHGGQWFKGKSLDGHGPMGPWIVTAGELDYNKLHLVTRINGVVKQDASTAQMYFKVPRIIAELSAGLTLEPGDIIATGTPPGVGYARTPPEFMKPGDVMETEISGIGLIRNTITAV
jgi:2-keto-4-pentenoate hydratase/2-oxohepta-3-ene-1,7-dioic acid hydratase in catechol pathway